MAASFVLTMGTVGSVRKLGSLEADIHKWLLSERHGYDVGPHGRWDWYRQFWRTFCRYRQLEHLHGVRRYEEFPLESFGRLSDPGLISKPAMQFVLERFAVDGWENLHFIFFGPENGFTIPELHEPLRLVDVNAARIEPSDL